MYCLVVVFLRLVITAGRYNNASEVVRAALRLLEEEENRVIALKKAIKEGIDSGFANDFEPTKHLAKLKASRNKNA